MTRKENLLTAMSGGKPDFVPSIFADATTFDASPAKEVPPPMAKEGVDGYGVHWVATDSACGAFTIDPAYPPVLTDVTRWREQVTFPMVTEEEWQFGAENDLKYLHHTDAKVLNCMSMNGIFERLHFLMSFEDAVISIIEEPEAVCELLDAITDYKIYCVKKIAQYYKPDYFTYLDDYAFAGGLMISPEQFRTMFKPRIRRIVDAVHAEGMKFKFHCCGKMETLLEDFIDLGIDALDPCQPCNDVADMIRRADGQVGIVGGLDVAVVDNLNFNEEALRAEVRRCIDSYGPDGYTLFCASVNVFNPREFAPGGRFPVLNNECDNYQSL